MNDLINHEAVMTVEDSDRELQELCDLEYELNLGGFKHWECSQCKGLYIDRDEHPELAQVPQQFQDTFQGVEAQKYFLGPLEVFCYACASRRGIPPLEE